MKFISDITEFTIRHAKCRCGKICFDKKTAQTKRNSLERMGLQRGLDIYPCPLGNHWHLTRKDKFRK